MDVRAGDVHLDSRHALDVVEFLCELRIFLDRAAADVDEDRSVELAQARHLLFDETLDADFLETDGIEHSRRRLPDPWRCAPFSGLEIETFDGDAADGSVIGELEVLGTVAEGAARSDERSAKAYPRNGHAQIRPGHSGWGSRSQQTASASKTGPSVQHRTYSFVYTTQPRQHPIPQPMRLSRDTWW